MKGSRSLPTSGILLDQINFEACTMEDIPGHILVVELYSYLQAMEPGEPQHQISPDFDWLG